MKKLILLFFTLIFSLSTFCQDFQGIVTYKFEIKNPMPDRILDSLFISRIGGKSTMTQIYYYKDNKYKSVIKETKTVQLYDPKTIRLYNYKVESDTATWSDGTKYIDKIVEIERIDEIENILGFDCQAIRIKSKMGETVFFFSNKYKLDAEKFKGHKYGFWEDYLKETGALPLKFVMKTAFSYIISTAIDIREENLSDNIFELPKFKHLTKNPF